MNWNDKVIVVKLGNGHWLCSSNSRPGDFHSIEYVGASDYTCSCEDHQLNKNKECRHVDVVREVEQHV